MIGRFCPGEQIEKTPAPIEIKEQSDFSVLINKLNDVGSTYVSMEIIQKLCQSKNEKAAQALFDYLQRCQDPIQLSFLTKHLGISFPDENTEKKLMPFLKHSDDRVVANTIEGLEAMRQPKHVAIFAQLLKHNSNRVRANAASAISRYDRKQGIEILVKMLQMKNKLHFVVSGCHAAEQFKDETLVDYLEPLLEDELTILDALHALKGIGGQKSLAVIKKALEKAADEDLKMLLQEFAAEMAKGSESKPGSPEIAGKNRTEPEALKGDLKNVAESGKPISAQEDIVAEKQKLEGVPCKRCGQFFKADSKICMKCGFILKDKKPGSEQKNEAVAAANQNLSEAAAFVSCSKCGSKNPEGTTFCSNCGSRVGGDDYKSSKISENRLGTRDQDLGDGLIYSRNPPASPFYSLLALFLPGLPQIIFGQIGKGLAIIVLATLLLPTGFGVVIMVFVSLIDGYKVGAKLKSGKPVRPWEFFPK
ncbi:MAG: HEAT repeat domain-containing protein [Candidatus Riflebacteria bacterium]